jgi:hypothetical protein
MESLVIISNGHLVPATKGEYKRKEFETAFSSDTSMWIQNADCDRSNDDTIARVCNCCEMQEESDIQIKFPVVHDIVKKNKTSSKTMYWTKNQVKAFFKANKNNPDLFSKKDEKAHWFFTKEKNRKVYATLIIYHHKKWHFAPYDNSTKYSHGVKSGARIFTLQ